MEADEATANKMHKEAVAAKEHLIVLKQTEVEAKAQKYGHFATLQATAQKELDAVNYRMKTVHQMLTDLTTNCDAKREAFNARRANMRDEASAITDALVILED